ncbi:MAG: hypothetical protein J6J36_06695 [Clostridia bacterium]|nr:hypothetical protein [Clostridia bacterium]
MTIRESLEIDIRDLADNEENFKNEYEEDNTFHFIKDQIDIAYKNKAEDDYSLSLDDVVALITMLNDTSKPLQVCLADMVVYLGRDSVGVNKSRPIEEKEETPTTFKQMLYTIEYGKIIESQGCNERYCTNEESFIEKTEYEKALKKILASSIGNDSEIGFYIECYYDEETLTETDLEMLKNYHCIQDCASKTNIIQQFLIDNTGKCIDYIY